MAEKIDRSKEFLKAVKDNAVVAVGAIGTGQVDVDGIAAGTVVNTGDYKTGFDMDGTKAITATTSDLTDQPGFTVPNVPDAPTLAAVAGDGKIDYTITAPAKDGGSPITKYVVAYMPAGGKVTTVDVDPAKLTGTVDKLTNDTEYTVTATAVNAVGESAPSPAVKATPKKAA